MNSPQVCVDCLDVVHILAVKIAWLLNYYFLNQFIITLLLYLQIYYFMSILVNNVSLLSCGGFVLIQRAWMISLSMAYEHCVIHFPMKLNSPQRYIYCVMNVIGPWLGLFGFNSKTCLFKLKGAGSIPCYLRFNLLDT